MEGYLRPDNTSIFPGSPSNSFIADEVASICPLITPSPPTNALVDPLPDEPAEGNYAIGEELASKLQHVQEEEKMAVSAASCSGIRESASPDSISSSSSAMLEEQPVCTQLLDHGTTYHPYTDEEQAMESQETTGKLQPLQLTFRNPPDNYCFMSWNWPLIRKISMYTFLAGLFAMVAVVVTMIATLPRKCNPATEWYQGSVFYEIFPGSYHDANQNMIGDLEGIKRNVDYIKRLGIRGVRLNSIFESPNYPENYKNATSLIKIAHQLGTLQDLKNLVSTFKRENISIILDLPVWPVVKQLSTKDASSDNETISDITVEFLKADPLDPVEEALVHWKQAGVEGFYLKGLENFVEDPNFEVSLSHWKKVIGSRTIFMISEEVLKRITLDSLKISVLKNVDLVDIRLQVETGVSGMEKQIQNILNGTLYLVDNMPWVHWTLGDENTVRLANRLVYANGTLGATLLQLMLPGTPSIFYGDEIGLQQIYDPEGERKDIQHLHQLNPMVWANKQQEMLSWLHGDKTEVNFDQIGAISNMTELRSESPSIYMNSLCKQGQTRPNAEVKYSRGDLLVIQRWYPRRKAYVVVSNFGKNQVEEDLSVLLYSGSIRVGPRPNSKQENIIFKKVSLWPGESVVIELD